MATAVRDNGSAQSANTDMALIGYLIFAPLLVLMLPFLPVLVLVMIGKKLKGS